MKMIVSTCEIAYLIKQKRGVLIYNFIESMGVLYLVGNYLENGQYISDS